MKTTQTFILPIVLFSVVLARPLTAQVEHHEELFPLDPQKKVHLNLRFGNIINIRGWEGDEVLFRVSVEINGGRLNNAFLPEYRDEEDGLYIGMDFNENVLRQGQAEDCPERLDQGYSKLDEGYSQSYSSKFTVCHRIDYDVFIPLTVNLFLETISADVEIREFNGHVDVKSISGFIDLAWPESHGMDLILNTVTGEAYSDMETLTLQYRQERISKVGYELKGDIRPGGTTVRLETVSGNIFLRTQPVN